jgi:hypothetical protein
VERVRGYVPRFTIVVYERGMRLMWRDRDPVVEAQVVGLRKLGVD